MIKTLKIKEPAFFKSKQAKELISALTRHFSQPLSQRSQSKFPISDIGEKLNSIKKELLLKTTNKCAYCESAIDPNNLTIDHFRPHSSAADENGKISLEHYWWLAMKWNNLLPVCGQCNSQKNNFFPLEKKRVSFHYFGKKTLFDLEKPLLIDPEFENPERYYYYDDSGFMLSYNKRGSHSIKILGLNRWELIDSRKAAIQEVNNVLLQIDQELIKEETRDASNLRNQISQIEVIYSNRKLSYFGARRYFIREFFKNMGSKFLIFLSDSFKQKIKIKPLIEKNWQDEDSKNVNNFELDSILIKNYKSINELKISFNRTNEGNAGWAILIGENGVGKSSTLLGTLKTLVGRNYSDLRFNRSEIKRGQDENASIHISFKDSPFANVEIGNKTRYFYPKDYFINCSILAFSPFKHSNKNDSYYRRFKGGCFVDNFVNPSVPLHNALKFILALTPEQFESVAIALLDLMMLDGKARIHRKPHKEEVWFQDNDSDKKHFFNELSDGYKSVITLGCNIIEGLLINNESIENASGFVVIDEIGSNLHPRWKMQIVKRLRRTFPNVQFLVTTHDPLCLKGIEENETYVLKSNNGELEVLTDLPNPSEYRADQLLTSEFFGLFSTVDPDMEEDFKEYYDLLYKGKDSLNYNEKHRFLNLKKELREKNHLGDTLREELLYTAIDEILAKHKKSEKTFSRKEVEKEVKVKAIELIDEFLNDLEE
jgi:uncharacterized protein (TIGR02646 family)